MSAIFAFFERFLKFSFLLERCHPTGVSLRVRLVKLKKIMGHNFFYLLRHKFGPQKNIGQGAIFLKFRQPNANQIYVRKKILFTIIMAIIAEHIQKMIKYIENYAVLNNYIINN